MDCDWYLKWKSVLGTEPLTCGIWCSRQVNSVRIEWDCRIPRLVVWGKDSHVETECRTAGVQWWSLPTEHTGRSTKVNSNGYCFIWPLQPQEKNKLYCSYVLQMRKQRSTILIVIAHLETKAHRCSDYKFNAVSFLWLNIFLSSPWIFSMIQLWTLFSVFTMFRVWTIRPKSPLRKLNTLFILSNSGFHFALFRK